MPRLTIAAHLTIALTLFACASRLPNTSPTPESCTPELGPADFPSVDERLALNRLTVGAKREIRLDDRLVFGLRLEQNGEVTDMVLEFTALGDSNNPSSGVQTLTLTPEGEAAREFKSHGVITALVMRTVGGDDLHSIVSLPSDFLIHGLDGVCKLADRFGAGIVQAKADGVDVGDLFTPEELDETWRGVLTLLSILRIVQGNEHLNALLERMVSLGDKLRVVFAGGISIHGEFEKAIGCAALKPLDNPAWCFPMSLNAGSQALLHFHVLITEPRSPFGLAGGLLSLSAVHAGDPDQRLTLVLIGASSGADRGRTKSGQ